MILKKITKGICLMLAAASISAVSPISANAANSDWKSDNIGKWYTEGNSYATGWRYIDDSWFYFDETGYMHTGWLNYNGKWYYLYPDTGIMAAGTQLGAYYVNVDGAWVDYNFIDGKTTYNTYLSKLKDLEEMDAKYQNNMQYTTAGYAEYYNKFAPQYDSLLNDIYSKLKESMTAEEIKNLQDEENTWINIKEKATNETVSQYGSGTITAWIGNAVKMGYTHDRIYNLLYYMEKVCK